MISLILYSNGIKIYRTVLFVVDNREIFMRNLIILAIFFSSLTLANPPKYIIENKNIESFLEIRVDSVTRLGLPSALLNKAKIIGVDGLTVITDNKGAFSIESMTSEEVGYPDFDMRKWPLLIMGYDHDVKSKKLLMDAKKVKEVLYSANNPVFTGIFETKNGLGYILFGQEKSVIYLTDSEQKNIITVITTSDMDEKTIKGLLQGVI